MIVLILEERAQGIMILLRIKEVAQQRGYNMSSLSRATDISFGTIKRLWRHPDTGVSLDTLAKIARVLEVSVADLMEEVPDN